VEAHGSGQQERDQHSPRIEREAKSSGWVIVGYFVRHWTSMSFIELMAIFKIGFVVFSNASFPGTLLLKS